MFKDWKRLFRTPSPLVMAKEELDDAKRCLLQALASREYASAFVTYQTMRIERLTKTIKAEEAAS